MEDEFSEDVERKSPNRKKVERQMRYAKNAVARITFDFNKHTEADLIEWLNAQPAKATYIKRLIREDMARQKTE